MAAGIGDLQIKILIQLFAGLHADEQAFSVVEFEIAGIGIDHVFGFDQIAMILDEPGHAVGCAALFIGGKREDEIAIRLVIFPASGE